MDVRDGLDEFKYLCCGGVEEALASQAGAGAVALLVYQQFTQEFRWMAFRVQGPFSKMSPGYRNGAVHTIKW